MYIKNTHELIIVSTVRRIYMVYKVLLADDEQGLRDITKKYLERNGFDAVSYTHLWYANKHLPILINPTWS